jgi:tripartite-type tricarboxylate transporter receptor subunit TctC
MKAFFVAALGAASFLPAALQAQSYPVRPVRLVVPFAAGGPVDTVARLLTPRLAEAWGQQVVIDNRPGANSMIGSDAVARAGPDGYTLLIVSAGFAINVTLQTKLPYDPVRDFTSITTVAYGPSALVTHPSLPVRNLRALIALAKARPGALTYGSSGVGAPTSHLGMELLKVTAGVDIVHVPYKSMAPALTDIIGGQVHMGMPTINVTVSHVRTGRLRALGVVEHALSGDARCAAVGRSGDARLRGEQLDPIARSRGLACSDRRKNPRGHGTRAARTRVARALSRSGHGSSQPTLRKGAGIRAQRDYQVG